MVKRENTRWRHVQHLKARTRTTAHEAKSNAWKWGWTPYQLDGEVGRLFSRILCEVHGGAGVGAEMVASEAFTTCHCRSTRGRGMLISLIFTGDILSPFSDLEIWGMWELIVRGLF